MKFEKYNIATPLIKAILSEGYKKPTDIQFKAIPHILNGEDLLAIAQTGTGKTAAFVIPILDKIHRKNLKRKSSKLNTIVMVPTRELAVQICEVFEKFGAKLKVKSISIFGGVDQDPQINKLIEGVDIIVTTPGRMFDLASQGYINLSAVDTLILDEADHMLDLGFRKDIEDLIKYLPKKRQTLFFSATINDKIKKVAYSLVNKPVRIQISPKDPVSKNVDHSVIYIDMDDKRFFLERLVNENKGKKIMVFVRTKVRAERVQKAMERVNINALVLHGGVEQLDRLNTLNQFKEDEFDLLIATDVSARGIDIPNVAYVVNYDIPDRPEYYIHRVGRTGRGRSKGQAFSFCSQDEKPLLKTIQSYLNKDIKELRIRKEDQREIIDLTDERKITMEDIEDQLYQKEHGKRKKRNKRNKNKE